MAKLTVSAVDDALTKTKAERSLRYYLEHIAWPVIEPLTTFRSGWHLDAMCDHAQALSQSQIRNLLVTIAPRHTKSIVMSVALPVMGVDDDIVPAVSVRQFLCRSLS